MSNQWNTPVYIRPARRSTPPPRPYEHSWPWTALACYVGLASFTLAALLVLR
jgi:hypothetical protein